MPTIEFSLAKLVQDLNDKIAELESARQTVQDEIDANNRVEDNRATLGQINDSLSKANAAKTMLMDSCCSSQGCFFEYYAATAK